MNIRLEGPETEADRRLREWFDNQERENVNRLEEGAKTIIQLVTGLYGALFAVLALADQPVFLAQRSVQVAGTVAMLFYLAALFAALAVVFPTRHVYQEDNLTSMQLALKQMLASKLFALRVALVAFLIGSASLALVILNILWKG